MRFFSERFGLVKARDTIQIDSMDEALRTGLWNALCNHQFHYTVTDPYAYATRNRYPLDELKVLCKALWLHYFKKPIDTLPEDWDTIIDDLRSYYFGADWNEVYDFIEFVGRAFPDQECNEKFHAECNAILEH